MEQYGMETIAFPILVIMVGNTVKSSCHVFALGIKFGQEIDVFLLKLPVQMEKFGMQKSMHVNVPKELIQIITNAIKSLLVEME